MKQPLAIPLTALLLAGAAQAESAAPICVVAPPNVPAVAWRGQASYQATATARDGRVGAIEIRSLTAGVDRRAQRAMTTAISVALQAARCQPGTHVFEQRFDFNLGGDAASRPVVTADAAAGAHMAPRPPAWVPVTTPDDCEVQTPALPAEAASSTWRGHAAYRAQVEFHEGRVQKVRTQAVSPALDRALNVALMRVVAQTMRSAQCPAGQQIIERRFDFDLSGEPTP